MSRSLMTGSIKSLRPANCTLMTSWTQRSSVKRKNSRKSTDGANLGIDDLVAEELVNKFVNFEKIDRQTHNAENRRNTMLGEIDRRRTVLGEALRRSIKEVEDAEFQVVEPTSAKRKTAA